MGGAVVSVMELQSYRSLVPHPGIADYKARDKAGFLRVVPGPASDKASPIYRSNEVDEEAYARIHATYTGPTFLETFRGLVEAREAVEVMGYRPVERVEREDVVDATTGKTHRIDVTYLGPTVRLTYGQVWERIEAFGRGLAALGIERGRTITLYQNTCVEWFVGIYGIWNAGMVAATVYANLGEAALGYALHQTESAAIICGGSNAANVIKLMHRGAIPNVPIIHVGDLPEGVGTEDVVLYPFDTVMDRGRDVQREGRHNPQPSTDPDDLALIMYTSGTTGDPKGVMHSHGSLAAGMGTCYARIIDLAGDIVEGDCYCAYLPMAHIMEFSVVNILVQRGCFIGFGSPRTLTDATARPHGDFTEFKPIFVVGVPRVFETLKKAIEAKLPPTGSLKRTVFDAACESRLKALHQGYETPYWNSKVFAAMRALLGGRARGILVGGGPMSAAIQGFINVAFGLCVAGYGMTETVCVGCTQITGDLEYGCGGIIEPGEEFKLVDTEHYKHTDEPEPRGELCLRGPYLFKGYYKNPELTKEALDEDGWFHTGDVASITSNGKLRIIGRVKALAKNSLGEYIAMEALEAIYSANPLLTPNGVCVLVHPDKNYITAIALTDEGKAMTFAKANCIEGEWPSILGVPEFQEAAAKSLAQTAKDANRAPFECVRHVRVLADEWTPENDVLTAAQKLKRRVIDAKYPDIIEALFTE